MTDQDTDAHSPTTAAEPLALRLSEGLGPLPTSAEDEAVVLGRLAKTPAEAYERGYLDGAARERERCAALCLRPPGWLTDSHLALATEIRNAILANAGLISRPN